MQTFLIRFEDQTETFAVEAPSKEAVQAFLAARNTVEHRVSKTKRGASYDLTEESLGAALKCWNVAW